MAIQLPIDIAPQTHRTRPMNVTTSHSSSCRRRLASSPIALIAAVAMSLANVPAGAQDVPEFAADGIERTVRVSFDVSKVKPPRK